VSQADPNPETALAWARELGNAPELPASLKDPRRRAKLVDSIDAPLISGSILASLEQGEKQRRLILVAEVAASLMPEVKDTTTKSNIALRLWAGCISAAKMIALETKSGPNTPEIRDRAFTLIDSIAREDAIYRAGVESAPAFKKLRLQPISLESVPKQSAVRRFVKESEDRDMRLLQPKLIILYMLMKEGKVKNNKSELSKLLRYAKTGWTTTMINELLEDDFVRKKTIRGTEYLTLTRKGRRKIAPLTISKFLPIAMASVALIPFLLAIDEVVLRIPIQPFTLLFSSALILLLAVFFAYETTQLEKEYYRL
jgi:DNA-binding MarR family transcriptional regulator